MSAESDYISAESANILRSTTLIRNLLEQKKLTQPHNEVETVSGICWLSYLLS